MRTFRLPFAVTVLAGLSTLTVACGPAFTIDTPSGMIELKNQTGYAYRAMTPDGFVVAVRVVDEPGKADVDFWVQAVTLHMQELPDYRQLGTTTEVASVNGTKGKELRFRHDEKGKPYLYVVRIFAMPEHLVIIEAGELIGEMEHNKAMLDAAMASVRLR